MSETVVVLGSGYAGAGAIQQLQDQDCDIDIVWISNRRYHLLRHEIHRCIRNPDTKSHIRIPVEQIKAPTTEFVHATVTDVDVDRRQVELEDDDPVAYDYLLIALGSRTAFFGIDGLQRHAHTLSGIDDAVAIHDAITDAARDATPTEPARIVVGGAGLSGIQTAGEIAEYRDDHDLPLEIHIVEGMDSVLPNGDPELQSALRKQLEKRDVSIETGDFVCEVDDERIYLEDDRHLEYDVLVWTGGITGRDVVEGASLETDERTGRIVAGQTFQTDDERVFAIGDCALVDQPDDQPAPPTAQAAWQSAEVASENIVRSIQGQPLTTWRYEDKGTVVSIGEDSVAHDVGFAPLSTFGGTIATLLKKGIAARWIAGVGSLRMAIAAWDEM